MGKFIPLLPSCLKWRACSKFPLKEPSESRGLPTCTEALLRVEIAGLGGPTAAIAELSLTSSRHPVTVILDIRDIPGKKKGKVKIPFPF
jgi:hypothetical protein